MSVSTTLANQSVTSGKVSAEPTWSNTFCIAGIATNVPTNNNTNNPINWIMFGIKIFLNFLFKASESSRYLTACSKEVVSDFQFPL